MVVTLSMFKLASIPCRKVDLGATTILFASLMLVGEASAQAALGAKLPSCEVSIINDGGRVQGGASKESSIPVLNVSASQAAPMSSAEVIIDSATPVPLSVAPPSAIGLQRQARTAGATSTDSITVIRQAASSASGEASNLPVKIVQAPPIQAGHCY